MKTLVIVPAYNEEANITAVVSELESKCPEYDYVIVNDGSMDRTSRICKENGYHLISLPLNLGLAGAFRTGMKFAYRNGYDCAIQLDADGQHDPAYIQVMIKRMESTGVDIVIGSRYVQDRKNFALRAAGNEMINAFIRLTTGATITDSTSGMRLYNRRIIRFYSQYINFDPEPDTIAYLIRCGARVEEVQVQMRERMGGQSYFHLSSIVRYMTRVCGSILFMQWFRKRESLS